MKAFIPAKRVKVKNIKITEGFWGDIQNMIIKEAIPYQEKILKDEVAGAEKSHAIENFKIAAGISNGEFYGTVFQDSDVSKWIEGVAYSLSVKSDPELEERTDKIISYIKAAQQEDGYLNTYFIIKEPEHKWQNLQEGHELYCAGHLFEAAAAYYEETGKRELLDVAIRLADHIDRRFGDDKISGIPGHPEVEIGLMKLYFITGNEKYKKLASYFVEQRGQDPDFFMKEKQNRGWTLFHMDPYDRENAQCHKPVREQDEAVGHCVRAVYLYTAMAGLAMETEDVTLYEACKKLWNNIVRKKMYITGGIGSTARGEAFTQAYDLPNDTAYAETCASVAMVMFAKQMLDLDPDASYADIMERELYNGVMGGMQLDGKGFFYVNPLETVRGISGEHFGFEHVLTRRPKWYACACCPPNLVRLFMSVGKYIWTEKKEIIYSHLFISQTAELEKAKIQVDSKLPWDGDVTFKIASKTEEKWTLAVRIPEYAEGFQVICNGEEVNYKSTISKGYIYLERNWGEDILEIHFGLNIKKVYANPQVRADAGCVAFIRGPIVYCFEQADQGESLHKYRIPKDVQAETMVCKEGILKDLVLLKVSGMCLEESDDLYMTQMPQASNVLLTAIPYFSWGNRAKGDMRVWMPEK